MSVSDDFDPSPRLSFEDTRSGKCQITRNWKAEDFAGNIATFEQTIDYITSKDIEITEHPQAISVSCGSLKEMTDVLVSMFKYKERCGLPVEIAYTDNLPEQCGIIVQRTWTLTDGCNKNTSLVQYIQIRDSLKPVSPQDGQINTDLNTKLSWNVPDAAESTDVYLWMKGNARTETPIIATNNYNFNAENLFPGTIYFWQIVFHYANNETQLSPIWAFETRHFVDLAVNDIQTPPTAFTGQSFEVHWTVLNIGSVDTSDIHWYDAVYISWDGTFTNSRRVALVRQRNILYPNDGYSSVAKVPLNEKETGNAYIFVRTNVYGYPVNEHNTTNNIMRGVSAVDVQLTPPPDLQILSVVVTGNRFFSGK